MPLIKSWKIIAALTALAAIAAFIIYFVTPKKYLAVATAAPGSSFAADRSRIFSQNIEALYSVLGTPDDLDLVVGTAKLDTVYLRVVDTLQLEEKFDVREECPARRSKIASIIKKNSRVQKSGYGELKIKAWDRDPKQAAAIANSILDNLRIMHQNLQAGANRSTLEALLAERAVRDSAAGMNNAYDTLITQYRFLINHPPPVLLTVENARPPEWHDRPRVWRNVMAVGGLVFILSLLLALVFGRGVEGAEVSPQRATE